MFEKNVREVEVDDDFDAAELARMSGGYSGADIKSVCREACMAPLRRGLLGLTAMQIQMMRAEGKIDKPQPVTQKDFVNALINVLPSVGQSDVERYEAWSSEFGSR
ncbi:unnamed protein product [Amoebophrya sp. A25]|nr:unnamed protein product [Amoebophrya sp. A25]|eukprot:GSA25T00027309001.1